MIRLTEHSIDLAVFQRDSPEDRSFAGGRAEMLAFLGRQKANIGRIETRDGAFPKSIMEVHFLRSDGANNLYWKLLRACAEKNSPKAAVATHTAMALMLHEFLKQLHNDGKTTSKLKPSEFHNYYMLCESDCVRTFGISPMDEDVLEFDHGCEPVNGK